MDFKLIKEPDIEDDHPTLRSIAAALDSLDPNQEDPVLTLFPSENIDGSRYLQLQYLDFGEGEDVPELMTIIEKDNYEDKYYSYIAKNMDEVKEIFFNYFSSHKLPSLLYWRDVTEDYKEAEKINMNINIFKEAFKIHRINGKEIYKGFGFKHLSDVTQYYVHPDNQSSEGTTALCQPIGESVVLFSLLLLSIINDKEPFGDYYYNEDKSRFYLKFTIPEDWHSAGIIDKEIYNYKTYLVENNIHFGAYDKNDSWIIQDKIEPLTKLYKLLPCFVILLAKEMETNNDFAPLVNNFIESPVADVFVNINEDFYQNHKFDEHHISYGQQRYIDLSKFISCASTYEAVRENKKNSQEEQEIKITQFPPKSFKAEYKKYIPVLGNELELQKELHCLCNAVQSGDCRSVLFHGPAGTGKTIACKKVCQAIALPILETINCTENLDEYVLGKYIPQGDKIIFSESYLTKAIRDGGAVVFEEINFAKPQYLAFLNSLLDDNGFVRLDSGESVKRHQNFRFFATMNLGYYGTKELNQALFNRFNAVIELPALSDDVIRKMLSVRVPECIPFIEKMISVYHKLRKKIENEELEIVISPRNLENWARLSKHEGFIKASEKTIIPIAKNDRALESAIKGIIYLHKWS